MIVYSSVPYVNSDDDMKYLDSVIVGQQMTAKTPADEIFSGKTLSNPPKLNPVLTQKEKLPGKGLVPEFVRNN